MKLYESTIKEFSADVIHNRIADILKDTATIDPDSLKKLINKKTKAALKHGLKPIVCVGETLSERENGKTFDVLNDHVKNGLEGINSEEALRIIIAYEPVWAIGTGRTATAQQAQEAQRYIRDLLTRMYNEDIANTIRIQYGGSVKPENITDILKEPDVDGALVGGASLSIESFATIVEKASGVRK